MGARCAHCDWALDTPDTFEGELESMRELCRHFLASHQLSDLTKKESETDAFIVTPVAEDPHV